MKTTARAAVAPIVQLTQADGEGREAGESSEGWEGGYAAPGTAVLARARAFAEPLLAGRRFDTGEDALEHTEGVACILHDLGAAPSLSVAAYLVYASDYLSDPEETVAQAFGASYAGLVSHTRRLVQVQRSARDALADQANAQVRAEQVERVRKMLLAFSRDLRVVLLRLASRLQTLRYYAATKRPCPQVLARESLQVFAPLANRLGIWQIKWEIEDLSFRFLQPEQYQRVARLLDEKRVERERGIDEARQRLEMELARIGLRAQVSGRPKHIYSIWKKMQDKGLEFARVLDLRALRVIVPDVPACYAALGRVHELWRALPQEFDDYIARPKANGYRSLHTVVLDERDRPLEIQIRTAEMHEHAESGIAAHWAYKEAGAKGYGGVVAVGDFEEQVAQARRAVLRQLLAWERDLSGAAAAPQDGQAGAEGLFEDRIYVLTPQASVIELPAGATPVDFAYTVHTDLGHRCRGARVDGAMVPLSTPLRNGQTVEILATKEGGPSLDWINSQLGFLQSHRARSKVRAWFNARALQETIARGREAVEKLLQREGRTAMKLDVLATQLGFRNAEALFEVVGKDEYSLRNIETLLRPVEPPVGEPPVPLRPARAQGPGRAGVLVVGVESLLTQLARCCRPAPPDAIGGYVTRGQGVAVHRNDCSNFRQMAARNPERLIPVTWGEAAAGPMPVYPVDVNIAANDRPGLLRDISEVFAKEKMNVVGVQTQSVRGTAWMTFTVEVADSQRLGKVLSVV
ncbi:MAG TPA: bifunctional (p)ppGpp synthetase/guanosine-3',5'-bis(diphosphate) 3'-pyrophosphohydrolase, partial [Burkholderiaceae bacterium]|nr:bifunctional (p)ppGpp synthetase/guanosine-3',5'-bis(diphosphate) 3'-pyrophosphohydrolase [Burkholderiaceae bacterium]